MGEATATLVTGMDPLVATLSTAAVVALVVTCALAVSASTLRSSVVAAGMALSVAVAVLFAAGTVYVGDLRHAAESLTHCGPSDRAVVLAASKAEARKGLLLGVGAGASCLLLSAVALTASARRLDRSAERAP